MANVYKLKPLHEVINAPAMTAETERPKWVASEENAKKYTGFRVEKQKPFGRRG